MKIKIRQNDAGALGKHEWAEMSDWLAELRDDGQADPAGDDSPGPARDGQAAPARDGRAGPAGDGGAEPPGHGRAVPPGHGRAGPAGDGDSRAMAPARAPVRAVIGDKLRMPIMWCEIGSCISRHADPSALGEADIRARAIGAGWRTDALGRMACPRCQQTDASFRATRPVVLWDRATAITMAARIAAVPRNGTAT